ncbi:uncharacterized protein EV154DRAFT_509105 [Mucor mucedo]|uniref:uncharacterized protein n=1 Tax=Mucor mucedo TaxID=29922 RepID=UPI00221FDF4D|nr:uncharacterized protein EV154DRAFT_509105 [Mucor mucedo]KAI7891239.1 hypothetical protein EV154DRAFT_509105 [Mucor mucedo]
MFWLQKLTTVKEWSNIFFVEEISKEFLFASRNTAEEKIRDLLFDFWNEDIHDPKSSESIRKKATRLKGTVKLVIDSRPMSMIINGNIQRQSRQILRDDLVQQEYDTLSGVHVKPSLTDTDQEGQQESSKKRKYLKKSDLRNLSYKHKVAKLNDYYGTKNVLDLTKNQVIPKRFKSTVQDILCNYDMLLTPKLQDKEYQMIQQISLCQSKDLLYSLVNDITPFDNTSELPFIKLATQKLYHILFSDVLKSEHHEDWYRINVYGDLFDFIFSVESGMIKATLVLTIAPIHFMSCACNLSF